MAISIIEGVEIPDSELTFTASRSGGPGGQNVNKVSSRVTLEFDLQHSVALSDTQRARIAAKLATRISKEGVLRVISQRTRSQEMNRTDTVTRFAELLRDALKVEPPRVKTRVPFSARVQRIETKKKRTRVKQLRSGKDWD
jgi:ribosome-associated protein